MFKDILRTYFFKYIATVLTFLTGILIARFFGPEGKGQISSYLFIPQAIILYTEFGLSESIMQFTSKKFNINKFFLIRFVFLTLSLSIIIYCVYVFNFNENFIKIGLLVPFLLVLIFLDQLLLSYIKGIFKIKIFNYNNIIKSFMIFSGVVLVCLFDLNLLFVLKTYLITYLLSIIFLCYYVISKKEVFEKTIDFKFFLNYSLNTYLFKVLNSTESIFDKLLIVTFLSLSEFGLYSVVVGLSSVLYTVFVNPISSILLPILNNKSGNSKITQVNFFSRVIVLPVFVTGLCMIFFSESLIGLIYGGQFKSSYLVFSILLLGVIFKSPMAIFSIFFKSINQPKKLVNISAITMPINIIGGMVLIPKLGILGAAIVSSCTYFLFTLIMVYKYIQFTDSNFLDMFIIKKNDIIVIKNKIFKKI
jgi:O-antigen/teichoic acid export membrane protein